MSKKFYMVFVEGKAMPVHKHISRQSAEIEALRLANNENKQVFVLESIRNIDPNMTRIDAILQATGSWADETFPKSTPLTIIAHMREEFNELIDAVHENNVMAIGEEGADVFLLLCHLFYKYNLSLKHHANIKLLKNKSRIWNTEPEPEGHFKHKES